jgi:CRP/FNR family transcriptional regulator, cyclic AMP receptor protein
MFVAGGLIRTGRFNSEQAHTPWVQSWLFNTRRMQNRMDRATLERPDDILTELAKLGDTRTWEPGATVVRAGDVADSLYIIHSGELRATVAGDGARTVELNTLSAGEMFGELMLSGALRAATVQVTARARLTRVTRAEVERALLLRPELALHLIHRLVQRVRTLTTTVGRLASVDVYGRLVGLFDTLAVDADGQRVVPGPLSQARIAERLGASKAMVNRLLQDLAKGGYIEVTREHIVLLKKLPQRW